jgi:hypothetical protein
MLSLYHAFNRLISEHRKMKTKHTTKTLEDSLSREAMGGTCARERSSGVFDFMGGVRWKRLQWR